MSKRDSNSVAAISTDGYLSLADIASGCRHLADTIKLLQQARATTLAEKSTERERADAYHVLLVHEPALRRESERLARTADRLAYGRTS